MSTNVSVVLVKCEQDSECLDFVDVINTDLPVKMDTDGFNSCDNEYSSIKPDIDIGPYILQPSDLTYMMMSPKREPDLFEDYGNNIKPHLYSDLDSATTSHELTSQELNMRIKSRHNSKPKPIHVKALYSCDLCPAQYKSVAWLKKHLSSHSKTIQDKENVSPKTAIYFQTHFTHAKYVNKKRKRGCGKNIAARGRTLKKKPTQNQTKSKCYDKTFICDICNKSYKRKLGLVSHITSYHSNKNLFYFCDECPAKFTYNSNKLKHKKLFHSKVSLYENEKFVCDACNKSFSGKCNLKIHITNVCNVVHGDNRIRNDSQEVCLYCKKQFSNKIYLKRHVNYVHLKKKNKKCESCTKKFITIGKLEVHRQTCKTLVKNSGNHLIQVERSYCNICNKYYANKASLERHNGHVHRPKTNDFDRKCYICDVVLFGKASLNRHMNSQHLVRTGDFMPFKKRATCLFRTCPFRKRTTCLFRSPHTVCNLCGIQMRKTSVRPHLKHVHFIEHLPYICAHCLATFRNKHKISVHLDKCSKKLC